MQTNKVNRIVKCSFFHPIEVAARVGPPAPVSRWPLVADRWSVVAGRWPWPWRAPLAWAISQVARLGATNDNISLRRTTKGRHLCRQKNLIIRMIANKFHSSNGRAQGGPQEGAPIMLMLAWMFITPTGGKSTERLVWPDWRLSLLAIEVIN